MYRFVDIMECMDTDTQDMSVPDTNARQSFRSIRDGNAVHSDDSVVCLAEENMYRKRRATDVLNSVIREQTWTKEGERARNIRLLIRDDLPVSTMETSGFVSAGDLQFMRGNNETGQKLTPLDEVEEFLVEHLHAAGQRSAEWRLTEGFVPFLYGVTGDGNPYVLVPSQKLYSVRFVAIEMTGDLMPVVYEMGNSANCFSGNGFHPFPDKGLETFCKRHENSIGELDGVRFFYDAMLEEARRSKSLIRPGHHSHLIKRATTMLSVEKGDAQVVSRDFSVWLYIPPEARLSNLEGFDNLLYTPLDSLVDVYRRKKFFESIDTILKKRIARERVFIEQHSGTVSHNAGYRSILNSASNKQSEAEAMLRVQRQQTALELAAGDITVPSASSEDSQLDDNANDPYDASDSSYQTHLMERLEIELRTIADQRNQGGTYDGEEDSYASPEDRIIASELNNKNYRERLSAILYDMKLRDKGTGLFTAPDGYKFFNNADNRAALCKSVSDDIARLQERFDWRISSIFATYRQHHNTGRNTPIAGILEERDRRCKFINAIRDGMSRFLTAACRPLYDTAMHKSHVMVLEKPVQCWTRQWLSPGVRAFVHLLSTIIHESRRMSGASATTSSNGYGTVKETTPTTIASTNTPSNDGGTVSRKPVTAASGRRDAPVSRVENSDVTDSCIKQLTAMILDYTITLDNSKDAVKVHWPVRVFKQDPEPAWSKAPGNLLIMNKMVDVEFMEFLFGFLNAACARLGGFTLLAHVVENYLTVPSIEHTTEELELFFSEFIGSHAYKAAWWTNSSAQRAVLNFTDGSYDSVTSGRLGISQKDTPAWIAYMHTHFVESTMSQRESHTVSSKKLWIRYKNYTPPIDPMDIPSLVEWGLITVKDGFKIVNNYYGTGAVYTPTIGREMVELRSSKMKATPAGIDEKTQIPSKKHSKRTEQEVDSDEEEDDVRRTPVEGKSRKRITTPVSKKKSKRYRKL